jgi:ribose transport system permease protein
MILLVCVIIGAGPGWSVLKVGTMLEHTLPVVLLCLGQTLVIATGRIDMALTSAKASGGLISVFLAARLGLHFAVPLAFAVVLSAGFLYGALIGALQVESFAFSLGAMLLIQNVCHALAGYEQLSAGSAGADFTLLGSWTAQVFTCLAAVLLSAFVLHWSRVSRWIRAEADDGPTFETLGGRRWLVTAVVYGVAWLMACLAAVVEVGRSEGAVPATETDLLLWSIAAAVLGGISLRGGNATVRMAFGGAVLFGVIREGLDWVHLSVELRWMVLGSLLLLSVLTRELQAKRGICAC